MLKKESLYCYIDSKDEALCVKTQAVWAKLNLGSFCYWSSQILLPVDKNAVIFSL